MAERRSLHFLWPVALAALTACGLDMRMVETIGLPATTTTSTSSTTTTTRPPPPEPTTTTTRPATTSTTRAAQPVAAPPPPPSTPSPLTGLPMDPAAAGRPVLVVKIDNAPKARPQVGVVGEGGAWVLSGGLLIPARWSKPETASVTRYVDASGAEVRLARGRTWIELVPPGNGDAY